MSVSNINPPIISGDDPLTSVISKIRNAVLAGMSNSSGDIIVNRGPNGTTLTISSDIINGIGMHYRFVNEEVYTYNIGVNDNPNIDWVTLITNQLVALVSPTGKTDSAWWNATSSYQVGDIVRVQNREFTGYRYDDDGNPDTDIPLYTRPGTWICVSPVPYNYSPTEIGVINGIPDDAIRAQMIMVTRSAGVNYSPIWRNDDSLGDEWPEEKVLGHMTGNGGRNGRYWELIGTFETGSVVAGSGNDYPYWL